MCRAATSRGGGESEKSASKMSSSVDHEYAAAVNMAPALARRAWIYPHAPPPLFLSFLPHPLRQLCSIQGWAFWFLHQSLCGLVLGSFHSFQSTSTHTPLGHLRICSSERACVKESAVVFLRSSDIPPVPTFLS